MKALDFPFAERANGCWSVLAGRRERCDFTSRVDALDFAIAEAKRYEGEKQTVVVSIEGADGHWRSFDTGMKSYGAV
jgi:hypothetical protein